MKNVKFVAYVGKDEVLVTTPELEKEFLKEMFSDPKDRNIDDYDRETTKENCACVEYRPRIRWTD